MPKMASISKPGRTGPRRTGHKTGTDLAITGWMSDRDEIEQRRKQTREHVETMRGQERAENVACSFCSKRQRDVLAMFTGASAVYICEECVTSFAREVAKRRA